jgi:hypothetical protein
MFGIMRWVTAFVCACNLVKKRNKGITALFYGKWPSNRKQKKRLRLLKAAILLLIKFYFTRSTYSPVRVSTLILSPSFTNNGTFNSIPFSVLMVLSAPEEVSPLTAGSA